MNIRLGSESDSSEQRWLWHVRKPSEVAPLIMSEAEEAMRSTLEWLLALPADERVLMEQATAYTFTLKQTAPPFGGIALTAPCVTSTINAYSLEATEKLLNASFNPALLNFAHGYNCGGGFEHKEGSQEESIFRETSAVLSLWPHRRSDDGPGVLARGIWIGDFDVALPRKEPFYPHTECGGIYSPHVRIVRDRRFQLRSAAEVLQASTFGLLSVAAQDLTREVFVPGLLKQKVRSILHMAATNGHDSVVLGAWGCGYFLNSARDVAHAFHELLTGEFAYAFKVAVFAIPGSHPKFEDWFPRKTLKDIPHMLG